MAGENWNVCVVEKGGRVMASMPYVLSTHLGMRVISKPALTQTLGPWVRTTNAKYAKRLSNDKELMGLLITQLPKYHDFKQTWHHSMRNWLPFYWRGFSQTTRYTYIINNLESDEHIWSNFQTKVRTDIKKARDRFGLVIRNDLCIDDFIELNRLVFTRQGLALPYSVELIRRIDDVCKDRGCREIFFAEDEAGCIHAAVYIIWDKDSAYYLMGGSNPELRSSGATSLCMWEAIKFASQVSRSFDFEGSMMEPVESFFRSFGAVQTPYSMLTHTPSKRFRLLKLLREIVKR